MEADAGIRGRPERGSLRPRLIAAALAVALLIGLGVGLGVRALGAGSAAAPSATQTRFGMEGVAAWAPGAKPAPSITTLTDQSGRRFSLSSLRGHPVALVFFDSHCKAQCPLEGRELAVAEQSLPAADRPVLVAVSVNTADTPASARVAIRKWGLAAVAPWHWLMGTRHLLSTVWHAYHIWVGPEVNGDVLHTEAVYLIDRRGFERSAYLYPFTMQSLAHDLRALA